MIKNDVSPLTLLCSFGPKKEFMKMRQPMEITMLLCLFMLCVPATSQSCALSLEFKNGLILIFILLVVHHIIPGCSAYHAYLIAVWNSQISFYYSFQGKNQNIRRRRRGVGKIDGGGGGAVGVTVVDGGSCDSNAGHFNLQQGNNLKPCDSISLKLGVFKI